MTDRTYTPAQTSGPVISISPKGNGVRVYATMMPPEEKIRLLKLALAIYEKQEAVVETPQT